MSKKLAVRLVLTLAITGGCLAYILWQLDVGRTVHILVHSRLGWFLGAVAIMLGGVPPMAFRWQKLLEPRGVHERLGWLNRAYLVAYTAGQVLPSAVGGDASRIFETARRHPGRLGDMSAIVVLERALGGVATLLLAAVGFALAIGQYDVGPYLWVEGVFVAGTEAKAPARPSGETRTTPGTVPRSRTKRSPPAKRHPAPESWSPGESAMYASGPSLPR